MLQDLLPHAAFKALQGNSRVISEVAKELNNSGDVNTLSPAEISWRREDYEGARFEGIKLLLLPSTVFFTCGYR